MDGDLGGDRSAVGQSDGRHAIGRADGNPDAGCARDGDRAGVQDGIAVDKGAIAQTDGRCPRRDCHLAGVLEIAAINQIDPCGGTPARRYREGSPDKILEHAARRRIPIADANRRAGSLDGHRSRVDEVSGGSLCLVGGDRSGDGEGSGVVRRGVVHADRRDPGDTEGPVVFEDRGRIRLSGRRDARRGRAGGQCERAFVHEGPAGIGGEYDQRTRCCVQVERRIGGHRGRADVDLSSGQNEVGRRQVGQGHILQGE